MRRRRSGLNFGRRKKKVNMTIVKEILSWTVEILITLVIAFTFVYFIGLRTSVVGQSMSETLQSGDEILVNRFIYKVSDPKPNDIIVFLRKITLLCKACDRSAGRHGADPKWRCLCEWGTF